MHFRELLWKSSPSGIGAACLLFACLGTAVAAPPPQPFGPVPSPRQLRWHELEYYGFIHFSINTFTDMEWGYGDEPPASFAPTELDPRQWAQTARAAGMRALILTAKHHDGFCLWPSRFTEHSVKNSPWRSGKGDVVAELAEACRAEGLAFGVYLSPWDRNHPAYGSPEYVTYYRQQLRELLTQYGEICEVWFDGANGGDGYYGGARETRQIDRRTYYDWTGTWDLVRELQPMAVMFSDGGPDIRWVGNENGSGSDTNWATLRRDEFAPGIADVAALAAGQADGTHWVPAEVDVSIRPGWFYHAHEDERVKTVDQLTEIYFRSVGNGCNLLLNVPPDRRGLFHEIDCERLLGLRRRLDALFAVDLARGRPIVASDVRGDDATFAADRANDGDRSTYWAANDDVRSAELTVSWDQPAPVGCVRLQEAIELGQRVEQFVLEGRAGGTWTELARGSTIGPRRIVRVGNAEVDAVRLRIVQSRACPTLSAFEVYRTPE
jgi:alpha-L-fucosidase